MANKYLALLALSLIVLVTGATANNILEQTNTQDANGNIDIDINQTASSDASTIGNSYKVIQSTTEIANDNSHGLEVTPDITQGNMNDLTVIGNAVDKDDTIAQISFQDASHNFDTTVVQDNDNAAMLTNFGDVLLQNNFQIANANSVSTISQGNSNTATIANTDNVFAIQTNIQFANENDHSSIDQDGDNVIDATNAFNTNLLQLDVETANNNVRSNIEQSWEFELDARGSVTADQQTIQEAVFNVDSTISQDGDNSASISHTDVTQKDLQTANNNDLSTINQVADNSASDHV